MAAVDDPPRAGSGAHRPRPRERPAGRVAHAVQQLAAGHAGGREEDVVAGDEIVDGEDALEVVARLQRRRALALVARVQPAEHRAVEAFWRAARDHALGRAADAYED